MRASHIKSMRPPSRRVPLTTRHVNTRPTIRAPIILQRTFSTPSTRSGGSIGVDATPDVLDTLTTRGYIKDVAGDRDVLRKLLRQRPVGFYAGIDPTASSLHLGHLLPLMVLFWLHVHGHNTVSLIGGATAQIGDPSGRLTSRAKTTQSIHATNAEALTSQVSSIWERFEAYAERHGFTAQQRGKRRLLNNKNWLLKLNVVDFLRLLGSGMRIGAMLGRDTVKNKMEQGDGMSFAEFTYPLLQGWDWWHMYQHHGVQVQIGGSDQFGNIVAGLDAIKAAAQSVDVEGANHQSLQADGSIREEYMPMGLTTPLLTTSRGEKFGKSAGNAIWLNADMTSPFDLYGFLLRSADEDVERYLNLFTFVSAKTISDTMEQHRVDPGLRHAQHLLAAEVLELTHGFEQAERARNSHRLLRRSSTQPAQDSSAPSESSSAPALDHAERIVLPQSLVASAPFARVLYHAGLASTRTEASRLIKAGGAYVAATYKPKSTSSTLDFVPIATLKPEDCASFLDAGILIIRMGKWKVRMIQVMSDNDFDKAGLDAPGWLDWKGEHATTAK